MGKVLKTGPSKNGLWKGLSSQSYRFRGCKCLVASSRPFLTFSNNFVSLLTEWIFRPHFYNRNGDLLLVGCQGLFMNI